MDNAIKKELVKTEISGKLLGYDIITRYENQVGKAPEWVNVTCNIIEQTARINVSISCTRDDIWNISATMNGNKSMSEILGLIIALKQEVVQTITSTELQ
jgi:hypothetical protein